MAVKFSGMVALLIALSASTASSQTVDDLVVKHIAARGGYEKIKAVQTIKITRTVLTRRQRGQLRCSRLMPKDWSAMQIC